MRNILLLTVFALVSCSLIQNSNSGIERYEEELLPVGESNPYRKMEIIIQDSINCVLVNTFYCNTLPNEYRTITQHCKYKRDGKNIIFVSKDNDTAKLDYIRIPPQNDCECEVFKQNNQTHSSLFGRIILSDYDKYCLIPKIQTDTLYYLGVIQKKSLFYLKKPDPFNIENNWTFVFSRN